MKTSIGISILILMLAAVFGWNNHRRLEVVTETHRSLVEEAAALGLSVDVNDPKAGALATKLAREDRDAEARAVAKELIAFAIEMEHFKESGEKPDEAMQQRMMESMDRMISLDAGQLKTLIAEFRASKEMEDETRDGMIVFALMTLASDDPQAALALLNGSDGLFEKGRAGIHLLPRLVSKLASEDPMAAVEWVRRNSAHNPDLINEELKNSLVKGAAEKDLKVAFGLIERLEMDNPRNAMLSLASVLGTPENRTEFLGLLRGFAAADSDADDKRETANVLAALNQGILKEGFKSASKWLADNELSESETAAIASGISANARGSETGLWISWMGDNLSGANRDKRIESTMREWTRNDYRAAGEWLAVSPEGPTKAASVSAYAQTVASQDPQTATEWALTLPEGEQRQETLRAIHLSWPHKNRQEQTERAAFAEKYGIK